MNDSINRFARARNALSPGSRPHATRPHGDGVAPPDGTRRHVSPVPHPSDEHHRRASDARAE
jgi:hypothetical protein